MECFNSICLGVRGGRETHSRSELVFVDLLPFKKPRNRFGIDFARLGIDSQPGKVYSSESIPWFLKRLQIQSQLGGGRGSCFGS